MPLPIHLSRSSIWLLTAIALAPAAQATDLLGLSKDALASDPTYAAARYTRDAAQEARPQARANLLPSVTANVAENATRIDLRPNGSPVFAKTYNAWGPSINISFTLYSAAYWDTLDQAALSGQQADLQFEQAHNDLLIRVAQAYFDYLTSKDALEAQQENRKSILEQREQAAKEFELGTKTAVDMQESQARLDQADAQEQVAIADLQVRQGLLENLVGHPVDNLLPLKDSVHLQSPEPDNSAFWLQHARQDNRRVLAAELDARIAKAQVKIAHDADLPVLSLAGNMQYQKADNYSVFLPINSATTQSTLGIQLTIPVYLGGSTRSRIREASALQARSERNLDLAQRTAEQDVRVAYQGVTTGYKQIQFLESAVRSARIQKESTQIGYRVGVRINLDVLNANSQLINTQRDLKKARYDFILNSLKLKAASGALSEDDVVAVNSLLGFSSTPSSDSTHP